MKRLPPENVGASADAAIDPGGPVSGRRQQSKRWHDIHLRTKQHIKKGEGDPLRREEREREREHVIPTEKPYRLSLKRWRTDGRRSEI